MKKFLCYLPEFNINFFLNKQTKDIDAHKDINIRQNTKPE